MKTYLSTIWKDPAAARKALVAIIGAVVMLAAQGLLPAPVVEWVNLITPILVALGVYSVHNAPVDKNNV